MNKRIDRYTANKIQQEHYSDFMNNFDLNPITGLLGRVTNEDAIKQSIKNLCYTNRTERVYDSGIGGRLRSLMFEPMDSVTVQQIEKEVIETIENNEFRVTKVNCVVKPNENENAYHATIYFDIINIPDKNFSINLVLKRVR